MSQTNTPDGEPEIASIDDFRVSRDSDGELLPVTQSLPGSDASVRVVPLTQGDANEYLPESGMPTDLDDDAMLELLKEFYVEPSFESVESLDELVAFGVDPLLMALMNASGFDYAQGMVADSQELVEAVEGNTPANN
jgi:hypothetical protein